jgi:hypothetical protein
VIVARTTKPSSASLTAAGTTARAARSTRAAPCAHLFAVRGSYQPVCPSHRLSMSCCCADPALCVAPNVCSPAPLASALDLESPQAGKCAWLWLDVIKTWVCVAGTAELAMDRSTRSPTRFAFTIPAKSTATYCFSFAYLAGQKLRISLQFDQPVLVKMDLGIMSLPSAFQYCTPASQLIRLQPGSFDPIDRSVSCFGFGGWYTPSYSVATIAGTNSVKDTNVQFSLDGRYLACAAALVDLLTRRASDVLAVIGDECKYDWEYNAYSECSKKCVTSRSTSGCRCSAGAVLPPYDEARCPTPVLNSTCFDGLCDGTL